MEDDVDGVRVQNKTCTWKISWKIRMENTSQSSDGNFQRSFFVVLACNFVF